MRMPQAGVQPSYKISCCMPNVRGKFFCISNTLPLGLRLIGLPGFTQYSRPASAHVHTTQISIRERRTLKSPWPHQSICYALTIWRTIPSKLQDAFSRCSSMSNEKLVRRKSLLSPNKAANGLGSCPFEEADAGRGLKTWR